MALRLGLLSTARSNDAILGAANLLRHDGAPADYARALYAYNPSPAYVDATRRYAHLLADNGVDAVYVSLPNGLHHEWTLAALAARKHVLCEKPYSRRPEEAEEAFEVARQSGLVLMEAFMYRHHPQAAKVKELVQQGAVGRVQLVRSSFSRIVASMHDT